MLIFSIIVIVVLVLVLTILSFNVIIVPQSKAYIVERLGAYSATWYAGLHIKIPFIDRIISKVDLKETVIDFEPQSVITKDNVTMQIDTVVFYQVTEPKLVTYEINDPILAINNLCTTTIRNIIGDMDLDHTLTSRDVINSDITLKLDEATDKWGIKVNRVELKTIDPPNDIKNAMEKQMKAERERRSVMIEAEGRKKSQILIAEGEKESNILKAEGEKESTILKAEAYKEKLMREAEGEAVAIDSVAKAKANALKVLKEAAVDDNVIKLKSLETLEKVADGRATKLIIPSELQNLTSLFATIKESTTMDNIKEDNY